jgi:hypothetical protein
MIAPFYQATPIGAALAGVGTIRAIILACAAHASPPLFHALVGTLFTAARFAVYILLGVPLGLATWRVWSTATASFAIPLGSLAILDCLVWAGLYATSAATLDPLSVAMIPAEAEILCAIVLLAGRLAAARKGARTSMPMRETN